MSRLSSLLRMSFVCGALLGACKDEEQAPEPPPDPAGTAAGGVAPVYPSRDAIPGPAQALCAALHTEPLARKAACCESTPGTDVAPECARNLAGALAGGGLSLDAARVSTCTTALARAHAGCDWVGPHVAPLPDACKGITQGTIADGEACRSSLECKGDLRCAGAGPTDPGRCRSSGDLGDPCGTAVDPLATYLRLDVDAARPPCADGYCDQNRCQPAVALGEPCRASVQCGDEARCADGACARGAVAKDGQACGGGDCASGLRCVAGRCLVPRPLGAPCTRHAECEAGCLQNVCAKVCSTAALLQHLKKVKGLKPRKGRPREAQ